MVRIGIEESTKYTSKTEWFEWSTDSVGSKEQSYKNSKEWQ